MGMQGFDKEVSRVRNRNHGIVFSPVISGSAKLSAKDNLFARVHRGIRELATNVKAPAFAAVPVCV